jgi:hypothetical protein
MGYRVAADAVLLLHGLFVLFAVLGGLLAARCRWVAWVHLPAAAWAAWIEFSGGVCPLTPIENILRTRAGATPYEGGFIDHYLLPLVYPTGLTPRIQVALGVMVVLANLAIYAWVLRRSRR